MKLDDGYFLVVLIRMPQLHLLNTEGALIRKQFV